LTGYPVRNVVDRFEPDILTKNMKKLITLSLIFAFLSGTLFATDAPNLLGPGTTGQIQEKKIVKLENNFELLTDKNTYYIGDIIDVYLKNNSKTVYQKQYYFTRDDEDQDKQPFNLSMFYENKCIYYLYPMIGRHRKYIPERPTPKKMIFEIKPGERIKIFSINTNEYIYKDRFLLQPQTTGQTFEYMYDLMENRTEQANFMEGKYTLLILVTKEVNSYENIRKEIVIKCKD